MELFKICIIVTSVKGRLDYSGTKVSKFHLSNMNGRKFGNKI
jgi:hypothetical protein